MELIISLIITAAAYLIVPTIFIAINRPYSLSTIKKIVIINGACVWLIFQIIRTNAGVTGTSAAVFLWSSVAYWMMKKILLREREKGEEFFIPRNENPFAEEAPFIPHDESSYEETVKPPRSTYKKVTKSKIAIAMLSLFWALSIGLNIYQFNAQSELQHELKRELEQSQENGMTFDEYSVLYDAIENNIKRKYEDELKKIDFFDEYVVFVEDDGTSYYHKYECHRFVGAYFWAYNIEKAIDIGYKPCPICCEE